MQRRAKLDSKADLHYAYQHGQDAWRGDYVAIKADFDAKFDNDPEALAAFNAGWRDEHSGTPKRRTNNAG